MGYRSLKRVLDVAGSTVLCIISFPLVVILALVLTISNRGTPFFYQERLGLRERPFRIIKFKTMRDARNEDDELLPDAERISALGGVVRRTSLDEIPQLINILRGEMSFIGPRPLLVRYLPYYSADERVRHTVRPGITGLAQVRGRNDLEWDCRLAHDVEYVEQISLALDARILLETAKSVATGSGVRVNVLSGGMRDLDVERHV
ncbi:sugar transferase [Cryobacterium glaciale]|uniref:Sugar transferase n=1 Tax=Cryobacterium glaciale TaxID=1259145 RepID=A0A4R8UTW0_9MICO|nr:sugar transferase [Cryobacterium glaciale]